MAREDFAIRDIIEIKQIRDGEIIATVTGEDLIVNSGLAAIAGLINGVVTNFFDYIAIGTGTTPPSSTDTALQNEITSGGGQRTAATCSRVTTNVPDDTSQLVATFNFTSSFAVTESGVFDSPSAGTMLCRQTFAALNVVSGDSLQVTFRIIVARP